MTNQSIPEVFKRKIAIDNEIAELLSSDIIPITAVHELRKKKSIQDNARLACMNFIAMAKGRPPINGGSSGAGEVFEPTNLEAVA